MGLPAIGKTAWQDKIAAVAVKYQTATVEFFKLASDGSRNVLWAGKARVQHLGRPEATSASYQVGESRLYRWQLDVKDEAPYFTTGTLARVVDGARNPLLESVLFKVDNESNSSDRAVNTIVLTTDGKTTTWA